MLLRPDPGRNDSCASMQNVSRFTIEEDMNWRERREAHLDMMVQDITFPPHIQILTSGQGIGIVDFEHKHPTCHVS